MDQIWSVLVRLRFSFGTGCTHVVLFMHAWWNLHGIVNDEYETKNSCIIVSTVLNESSAISGVALASSDFVSHVI